MLGVNLSLLRIRDKLPRMNPKLTNFGNEQCGKGRILYSISRSSFRVKANPNTRKEEFYILFLDSGKEEFYILFPAQKKLEVGSPLRESGKSR